MTDDDKLPQELTTQQRAAIGKTTRNGVSGRLKAALDDMLDNGTPWDAAGLKANLTVRAMRLALKRPTVLKYLRQERRVLLARLSAANLHALAKLRSQDQNLNAAVSAAKALESLALETFGESHPPGGARAGYMIDLREQLPGLVVQINVAAPEPTPSATIDITPRDSAIPPPLDGAAFGRREAMPSPPSAPAVTSMYSGTGPDLRSRRSRQRAPEPDPDPVFVPPSPWD